MALADGSVAMRDSCVDVGGSQLIGRAECTEKKAVNAHQITGTQTLVEAGHYTAQFVVAAES